MYSEKVAVYSMFIGFAILATIAALVALDARNRARRLAQIADHNTIEIADWTARADARIARLELAPAPQGPRGDA